MSPNIILTTRAGQDPIEKLKAALAENQASQPTLFLDFSDIRNCRVMSESWCDQIAKTGQSPVTLIFDMTKLEELGSWNHCLSFVFSERSFGANDKFPKSWSVVFVIQECELDQLPGCRDLATLITGADDGLTQIVEACSEKRLSRLDPVDDSFDTPGM